MLRAAIGFSAITFGAIFVGSGIAACILLRKPAGRALKSVARNAAARSTRVDTLFETLKEELEDLHAEADALRASTGR